ncbi:progestin and adipoQ receptor family member 3-like isoform X2 [Clavelina lepadiformis]|uniref:progestin and adipoQ receptor family member 3-like isoform X2 n=1 Tax=Clavelina lepadiformis TaxID=159417 RepID=UPI0040420B01
MELLSSDISVSPSQALRHVRSGIHLYSFDEVPEYQQDNPFITHGYRSYLSAKQCFKSILIASNELVNIWTHGGVFFLLLILMFHDHFYLLPPMQASVSDHFIFLTFSLCIQACMVCSASYHTFNCHIYESVATRWHAVDLYGITVGMMGCYIIGLYYGFYCYKGTCLFYVAVVFILIVGSGFFMMHPKYFTKKWSNYRLWHLCTIAVFGLLPTLHWTITSPSKEIEMFLPAVLTFYMILAVAASFYVSKFPERFWPGKFNFVGQSHNLWHVLTGVAFLHWRQFALTVLQHRLTSHCLVPSLSS